MEDLMFTNYVKENGFCLASDNYEKNVTNDQTTGAIQDLLPRLVIIDSVFMMSFQ